MRGHLNDISGGPEHNIIAIQAIAHRVVHGADEFTGATLINDRVLERIKDLGRFAPLHNPISAALIEQCRQQWPRAVQVAVFDTAEYQHLCPKAYVYGLPRHLMQRHGIRKYGFHGISHGYVAREAATFLNKPLAELRLITCHLGHGASVTAYNKGKAVDTSMGLTPLEGLVMATRTGDVDPGALLYLMEREGLDTRAASALLNHQSGLYGLCGRKDMRDILQQAHNGDVDAQQALEVYTYRIQKYIGAYTAALKGVDALVFTAGIGEHSPLIRERILACFDYLGLILDKPKNQQGDTLISTPSSYVSVLVIPTHEELAMARQTYALLRYNKRPH
jgi:acetate kinase